MVIEDVNFRGSWVKGIAEPSHITFITLKLFPNKVFSSEIEQKQQNTDIYTE